MVNFKTDADHLTDLVVMVTWHQREHPIARSQLQGVQKGGTAKHPFQNFGPYRTRIVVLDIIGSDEHVNIGAIGHINGLDSTQLAQLEVDAILTMHPGR